MNASISEGVELLALQKENQRLLAQNTRLLSWKRELRASIHEIQEENSQLAQSAEQLWKAYMSDSVCDFASLPSSTYSQETFPLLPGIPERIGGTSNGSFEMPWSTEDILRPPSRPPFPSALTRGSSPRFPRDNISGDILLHDLFNDLQHDDFPEMFGGDPFDELQETLLLLAQESIEDHMQMPDLDFAHEYPHHTAMESAYLALPRRQSTRKSRRSRARRKARRTAASLAQEAPSHPQKTTPDVLEGCLLLPTAAMAA